LATRLNKIVLVQCSVLVTAKTLGPTPEQQPEYVI